MDAAPPFSAPMHRIHRVMAVAITAAGCFVLPASASADPRIERVTLTSPGLPGEPLTVEVAAKDPAAPVTGVDVRFPGRKGGFSMSSCALKPNGRPDQSNGYGRDKTSTFQVPWVPDMIGPWPVSVQVTSGGCGLVSGHARKDVTLTVGLGDLPVFPGKGKGLVKTSAVDLQPCASAYRLPTARNGKRIRGALLCLINVFRQSEGLPPLKASSRLRRAALAHTRDMVARRYFDHTGPSGGPSLAQRLQAVGYWPATAAENIAWGGGVLATPYAIFLAWMDSPGHRQNMLNPKVRELGTGVSVGGPQDPADGATYTTEFGVRY